MRTIKKNIIAVVALLALTGLIAPAVATAAPPRSTGDKVRKELVTLPYYGVFDNLAYEIQGDTVILSGQVVRPSTRKDAERRVKKIEGVSRVVNNIEVLPVSGVDDSIRQRTYRAVFRSGGLYRYAMGADPSIHIVVRGGHVTLEGVVSNQMDSQLAYMAANGVSGVFSVTNNLSIQANH